MDSIAVLLTVHNRRAQTLACLRNLYAQRVTYNVHMEVYMVDDGCTDGTAEAVSEQFPDVQIIHADGSLYWNRGMHKAWQKAANTKDYDYYLWLNDDTLLFEQAVDCLLLMCKERNNEIIAVGATKASRSDKLTYGGRNDRAIPPCEGKASEIKLFNGNIVMIPRAVHSILGNLDYYYTHSKGDFDYGIRAGKSGIKMFQCGTVLGICDEHEHIDAWCNPEVPFPKRWQLMLQPNGMPPHETFHYEKQINVLMAAFHYVTVIVRCIFPQLWIRRYNLT